MSINLSDFGEYFTNKIRTRNIVNNEGTGINSGGLNIDTNNNKININSQLDLNIGTTTGDINIDVWSGDFNIGITGDINIGTTEGNINITDTDINIGTTNNGINLNNNTFLNVNNLVLDTSQNDGAFYMNKQDFSTDTSGDWRLKIDGSNDLVIENYNGSSWITKLKLESG